jgi:hypothetical protein
MKAFRPLIPRLLAALVASGLSCATTTFESTWRAPDARPLQLAGKKVVGLFVNKDLASRRSAEDAMAREISAHGAQGVPAYAVLGDDEIRDKEKARAKLEQLGFAGAVVMRIAGRETKVTYQPPTVWASPYYGRFYGGYWGYGWGHAYDPGYLSVDKIVKVETLVYSLEQDKLVWAGVSRTVDPKQIDGFIRELAKAVASQMEKDGLLPKS